MNPSSIEALLRNNNEPSEEICQQFITLVNDCLQSSIDLDTKIVERQQQLEDLRFRRAETQYAELDKTSYRIEMDVKIADVQRQLSDLRAGRQAILSKISQYSIILLPIRRLPADILYQIFQYCLPTHRNPIPRRDEFPLVLTHVCRTWRSAALSFPRLWAQVHIAFTEDQTTSEESILQGNKFYGGRTKERMARVMRARLDAIKEWLSRSQSCPLSISIGFSLNRGSTTSLDEGSLSSTTLELCSLVDSVSSRLQNFEFVGTPEIYRILESMFTIKDMTILTTLKIRAISDGRSPTFRPQPIRLLNAPNLTRISLAGHTLIFWDVSTASLEWKSLTSISFHQGGLSNIYVELFLRKCSNLVYFLAQVVRMGPDQHIQRTEPINLPFLAALCIDESVPSELMRNIYERIDAPRLKWVNYSSEHQDTTLDGNMPIIQLLRNCRELKKLSFDGYFYSHSAMLALYQSVPGITDLSIGEKPMKGGKLYLRHRLTRTRSQQDTWNIGALIINGTGDGGEDDSTLLPHLETLNLFCDEKDVPAQTLHRFIESRTVNSSPRKVCSTLKTINVPWYRDRLPSNAHINRILGRRKVTVGVNAWYHPLDEFVSLERRRVGALLGRTWCEFGVNSMLKSICYMNFPT